MIWVWFLGTFYRESQIWLLQASEKLGATSKGFITKPGTVTVRSPGYKEVTFPHIHKIGLAGSQVPGGVVQATAPVPHI